MISSINGVLMIVSSCLFSLFYAKSVQPAKLEKKIGEKAYARCKTYRIVASLFELVALATYIVYYFFPLPIPLSRYFPWSYWISVMMAVAIGIPSIWIMAVGLKDAGEEALSPKKEHRMYRGIYDKIRHPQALGEVFLWWVVALLLHSPFLAIYSLIWFPIFYMFCAIEEKDLVLRYGDDYKEYMRQAGMFIPKK